MRFDIGTLDSGERSLPFGLLVLYEPGHEKMCLMAYVNNKGADQPVHLGSLISAFIVPC